MKIIALEAERSALEQQVIALDRRWNDAREKLADDARKVAETEVRQDDERRIELMAKSLDLAVAAFHSALVGSARELAPKLARSAVECLLSARDSDSDLLARAIERRLETLEERAVVELRISASDVSKEAALRLSRRLGAGVNVSLDTAMKPGTAKIGLRLGEVPIDLATGIERLLDLLDADQGHHEPGHE